MQLHSGVASGSQVRRWFSGPSVMSMPIYAPMSTRERPVLDLDVLAQCARCKQVSSYDRTDALVGRELVCTCGGPLRLFGPAVREQAAA
jgi:hypothetical protein